MGISVSVVVAVSSEALDRPVAALSYAIPVTALSYIQLNATTYVDLTGKYKLITDSTVVLDSKVLTFGKALVEQAVVTDQKTFEVGKGLSDSVTFLEEFTAVIVFIREFTDSAGVTDAVAIEAIKGLVDAISTSDTQTFDTTKLLQDGVAMNDAFDATDGSQWSFTKGVSNVVFVAESLAKALTKAPFTDDISLLSAISLQPNKHLADNLGTGDSGSLRSQGYADFSYFAEDYVGDSRTF